jgi:hypothetical protein
MAGYGILALNVVFVLWSWWGALFGPAYLIVFGVGGLLVVVLAWIGLDRRRRPQSEDAEPDRSPELHRLLRVAKISAGTVVAVASIVLFAVARSAGSPSFPAFQQRAHYLLVSHGTVSEVSRLRFIIISAGFASAWHAFVLFATFHIIESALYGSIETNGKTE